MQVTVAIAQERNRVLREAVLAARAPVRNAAVALTEMDKLRRRLTPECHGTVLEGFVALAEGQGPRQIRALRPALIAKYGHLGEFQRREDRLKHGTALSQPFDDDGMAEYRLRLDPEGSAVLEAILGPLAAPQPSTEHGSDTRTSDQRRADALVEVCRRAAAAGGAAPATAKAAVVVTMGYQDLLDRTGAGTTLTGELLAPETVRKMACDAASIPVVLGSQGRGARPRPDRPAGHPKAGAGPVDPRPGVHLPRLLEAPRLVSSHTTSGTGATAARPTCRTWPCSARDTTPSCTRSGYTATVTALGVTWHL